MTTVLLSDKHRLAPGQVCGHCGLKAPEVPLCWWCERPMTDWPVDAEAYLLKHGWTKDDDRWIEPDSRCLGHVTEDMVKRLKARKETAEEYVRLKLVKDDPFLLPQGEAGLARVTAELEAAETALSSGGLVKVRGAERFIEREAVRLQLNDGKVWATERTQTPALSERQVERFKESVRIAGSGHKIEARKAVEERQNRKQVEHHDRCHICLQ